MVPNGWEVKKFGDLFNVKSGFGFKHSEYVDSGTPLIKIDNVSHGYVKWNNVSYLPDIYREEYSDILLKEGDLLLALNRPITQGKLKLVKLTKNDVPSILYQRVGRIDFKTNDLEKDFYLYLLDTAIYRFVSHKAIGSDQPFISTTELKKLNIVKPPLPEQRKIAKILSTWDKAISTTERLIDNSKQQKKALMQQLLTGKKRLLDDSGKPFEGEWEEVKLADVVKFNNGKGHEKHIVEDGKYIVVNSKYISTDGHVKKTTDSAFCLANVGDVLMVMSDVPNGKAIAKCFYVNAPERFTVNQRVARFRPKSINSIFLYYTLNRNSYYLQFDDGVKQTNLRKDEVLDCPVFSPSDEEQQKIASVLTNADLEIELLEQQLAGLKQEKKSLMQQLLTGKRRVAV